MKTTLLSTIAIWSICAGVPALSAADEKSKPASTSSSVELVDGTWKDVEALIQKHKGKIVVVDIWSTSCLPCMTEFPNLVKLQQMHSEQIVCVSFNVDYVGIKNKSADFYRPRVEEFLKKQKAEFTNILSTTASDSVFEALELSSIPAVYVYGTDGQLAMRFDDSLLEDGEEEAFSYEKDINPFIKTLLKSK